MKKWKYQLFLKKIDILQKIDDLKINMDNIEKYKDDYPEVSSKRDFTGAINKIENLNNV